MNESLPIDKVLPEILEHLKTKSSIVVRAEPGAGKTTRIPVAIAQSEVLEKDKKILVLEPRRMAARMAAVRIAKNMGCQLGTKVGYQIRFENRTSANSQIIVMTEGLMTKRLQSDPFLENVGCVILDEFHERSVHTDLAISLLKEIQQSVRPDLRLVIMSATLSMERLSSYLSGAPCVDSAGRSYPVTVHWKERVDERRPIDQLVGTIKRAVQKIEDGDVLVFLPGAREILQTQAELQAVYGDKISVFPLYSALSSAEQDAAITPQKKRKIILSTNIAESSLTIPGVKTVVDMGLERTVFHDAARGLDQLKTVRISRASAEQRAGRAGRIGPGHVFRMWTKSEHQSLKEFAQAEIHRIDLASTMLVVLRWAAQDPKVFDWFEAPSEASLQRGLLQLRSLNAVEDDCFTITKKGEKMLSFPLHPRLAAVMIRAQELGDVELGAKVCTLIAEGGRAKPNSRQAVANSDFEIPRGQLPAHLERTCRQIVKIAKASLGSEVKQPNTKEILPRMLLAGFSDRVAKKRAHRQDRYRLVSGRGAILSRNSRVREEDLIIAIDIDDGHSAEEALIRQACKIKEDWLQNVTVTTVVQFNHERLAAEGVRQKKYQNLVLAEQRDQNVPVTDLSDALLEAALQDPERALKPSEKVQSLIARIEFIRRTLPELNWPQITWESVLPLVCSGLRSFAQIQKSDQINAVKSLLGYPASQQLDEWAPKTLTFGKGKPLRLRYDTEGPPVLAIKLQRMFGVRDTPRVANGRVPIKLELLAPNMRPVQVTQDLMSFWQTTYPEVRKQLRARYAKHAWPEDPFDFSSSKTK
ncbi:MAG: ATP-dependent helicase HrpB [Myxococcota bacterium]|nr:ATP-dependent helicase HrpB [Myxococcota bacterium]